MSNGNGKQNRKKLTGFQIMYIILGAFFAFATLVYLIAGNYAKMWGELLLLLMEVAFFINSRDNFPAGGGSLSLELAGFVAGILGNIIILTN